MPEEIRLVLSGEDFGNLISGEVVTLLPSGVVLKLALSDIGFVEMLRLVQEAMRKADTRKLDRRAP